MIQTLFADRPSRAPWLVLLGVLVLLVATAPPAFAAPFTAEVTTDDEDQDWGTGTEFPEDPFNTNANDSRAQVVYLASELIAAGLGACDTIEAIELRCKEESGRDLANFRIRLQHTNASTSTAFPGKTSSMGR